MEILDFFLIAIGAVTLFEAATRLDMIRAANEFKKSFLGAQEVGSYENSTSYKIMMKPLNRASWNPGIGSYLNDRPILLFLGVIVILAIAGEAIGLAMVYPKLTIVFLGGVFAIALHNGPDKINIEENYLQQIIDEEITTMNGHDQNYLTAAFSEFRGWSFMQGFFGFCILVAAFLPPWFLLADSILIAVLGLLYLGSKYSIHRGVFGEAPRI